MEIWLDTVDFDLIESAKAMGVLYGITTNPSILAKSQLRVESLLDKILHIQNGPVTAQVTAADSAKMVLQGEDLYKFSNRIIVKVPVTQEGLKAIHILKAKNIPVMATAVFDLGQVLLAAKAGATYIAPYFSSICELDMSGFDQFKSMSTLLERYQYPAKIIAASLKSAEQVRQCLEIGTQAVTLNKEVFSSFIENHPETTKRLDKFSKDWQAAQKPMTLLL